MITAKEYRKTLSGSYELNIVKVLAMVKTHQNRGMVTPLSSRPGQEHDPAIHKGHAEDAEHHLPVFQRLGARKDVDDRQNRSGEPDEVRISPEPFRLLEGQWRARHPPRVHQPGHEAEWRDDHGYQWADPAAIRENCVARANNDTRNEDDTEVPGETSEYGEERGRDPMAPRERVEARSTRRDEEGLGVAQAQNVRGWKEDVEQDGPIGDDGSKDLSYGQKERNGRGEPQDEGQDHSGLAVGQTGDLDGGAYGQGPGGKEGPPAAVALVDDVMRVPVLRDEGVPVPVPACRQGAEQLQMWRDPLGTECGKQDRDSREDVVTGGTGDGMQPPPVLTAWWGGFAGPHIGPGSIRRQGG